MNKLYFTFLLSIFSFFTLQTISAQEDCNSSTAEIDLDANSVSARLLTGGNFWWDLFDGSYYVPKPEPGFAKISSLFAGALWMGGISPVGNMHLAGQTYGANDSQWEYWPGPLDNNGLTDRPICQQWDRFFEVQREDVRSHQADWDDDKVIDGPIPQSLRAWPAIGNPYFFDENGFDLPISSGGLAPFFDRDEDGLYDPSKGDYPLCKGDQSIWWVFNDSGGLHLESQGAPVNMEVQVNAFSFNTEEGVAETTTFYDFRLIYKGNQPLNDFWLAMWVDPDLGCGADDFIGCLPDESLAFVYNGDDNDQNCGGVSGYGTDLPTLGIKVLNAYSPGNSDNTTLNKFMFYNSGNSTNNSATTDPQFAPDYYNYMKGLWRDETPLSQGGDGYNPGAEAHDFAYDGNPSDPNAWSECTAGSQPGDRRFLMSFGPFNLQPGAIGELSYAVVWLPSQTYPCPDVTGLVDAANEMKELYDTHSEDILSSTTNELIVEESVTLVPNPASSKVRIEIADLGSELSSIQFLSIDGKLVMDSQKLSGSQAELSVQDLQAGLFLYRVRLTDGRTIVGRFVKQ